MIIWDPGFEAKLHHLRAWTDAVAICEGVIRFHDQGEGRLVRVGRFHRLYVAGFVVALEINRAAETVTALDYERAPRR